MTTSEKILLLACGAFTIMALLLGMFIPINRLFAMPTLGRISLYVGAIVFFLLFVKYRQNTKAALAFMWILCAFFMLALALFILAVTHI
ncbi:MAG TPA: hypothetical protein DEB31_04565 [Clostridiales bacterium]|nr:hypothetical protein [Clostridiales bacterium]